MSKIALSQPSWLFLRLQTLWRWTLPFWLFRDASQGTIEQRAANYRYNRAQRKVLPFYIGGWVGIAACMLQLTTVLTDLMLATTMGSSAHLYATLACMVAGIGFALSCVVLSVLFISHLFLAYVER